MNNVNSQSVQAPDPVKLWQALASFAGRVAQTDDPKAHQAAGQQLQAELRRVKAR